MVAASTRDSPGYFSIMTADVRYDKELSDFAKVLYSDITALCNKKGFCSAKNQYFAEIFDKSKRTISATIKTLEDAGYIQSEVERDERGAVISRKIWISNTAQKAKRKLDTPIEENFHRGIEENFHRGIEENFHRGIEENFHRGIEENFHRVWKKTSSINNININNTSNNIPPISPRGDLREKSSSLFQKFWTAYPRKEAKVNAEKAFAKLDPTETLLQEMLTALAWQSQSAQWLREDGRYIPLPAAWIKARRWADVRPPFEHIPNEHGKEMAQWEKQWLDGVKAKLGLEEEQL